VHLDAPGAQQVAGWSSLGVAAVMAVLAVVAAANGALAAVPIAAFVCFAAGTGVACLRVRFDADAPGLFIRNHVRRRRLPWRDVSAFLVARDFDRYIGRGTTLVLETVMGTRIAILASYLPGKESTPEQRGRATRLYEMRDEFAPYNG
jgi:hypothetical protein